MSQCADRFTRAAPEAEELLQGAVEKGESLSHQTRQLLLLLEDYGPEALRRAVSQALERQTPRASAVAFLLQRSRRAGRTALPVDLSRHPELEALDIQPHPPEDYDDLTQSEPESE